MSRNGGQHPFASFRQLKQALTVFYQPVEPAVTARDRLMSFKQTGTYQDYVNAYQGLMLQIPDMAEDDRIHRFIYGLRDSEVQTHVMTQSPDTLEEAINAGAAADKRRGRAQGAARYNGYRSGYIASAATPQEHPPRRGLHPWSWAPSRSPPELSRLCWNCDEDGHMSGNAPNRGATTAAGTGGAAVVEGVGVLAAASAQHPTLHTHAQTDWGAWGPGEPHVP